jgi:uncharacterized protein affecting Mg2+/Co2+ transport
MMSKNLFSSSTTGTLFPAMMMRTSNPERPCFVQLRAVTLMAHFSLGCASPTRTIRILSRRWWIYDRAGELAVEVPPSPGVIGFKPELLPGASFEYYSGTDVDSENGCYMMGSLGVVAIEDKRDDETFDATVPRLDFDKCRSSSSLP